VVKKTLFNGKHNYILEIVKVSNGKVLLSINKGELPITQKELASIKADELLAEHLAA
jgi:hypothetical protein